MKKIINHIISLLLAAIFLVSFTGVRLLVHHCSGSGTSEIVFASEASDCCGKSAHHSGKGFPAHEESSCCTPAASACYLENPSACCDFESIYLKGEYDLVVEKAIARVEMMETHAVILYSGALHFENYSGGLTAPVSCVDPPPRLSGREFVVYSHQMKIG